MNLNIFFAYLAFFFQGITFPLVSIMLIEIASKYSVDTSVIGYILSLNFLGGAIATISGGYFLDKLEMQKLALIGIIVIIAGAVALTTSTSLIIFAFGYLLSGLGTLILVTIGNYIIVRLYQGEKRASQLNIANFFFSFGALLIPVWVGFLLKNQLRWEYIFLSPFIFLLLFLLITYLPAFGLPKAAVNKNAFLNKTARFNEWNINVFLSSAALALYCMLELSFSSWIVVYLRENLTIDVVAASFILTLFYIFHAIGRLLSGIIIRRLSLYTYILVCAVLGLICSVSILFFKNYIAISCLTALLALTIAGLYPCILSYGTLQVKNSSPNLVSFFMFIGIMGAVTGLIITSCLKQNWGAIYSLGIAPISALGIIIFIKLTTLSFKKGDA